MVADTAVGKRASLDGRAVGILLSAVAIETKTHGKGRPLFNSTHCLDGSVTCLTRKLCVDVNGVVEINVVWKKVDARPGNRLIFCERLSNFYYFSVIGQHLFVAVHTNCRRRNACMTTRRSAKVTIFAGNLHRTGVQRVGILNRLTRGITLIAGLTRRQYEGEERKPDSSL